MSWWVLVKTFGGSDSCNVPKAIGPYPSEEMCRLAARSLIPDDRQFWPEEERQSVAEREKRETAKREAKIREIQLAVTEGQLPEGMHQVEDGFHIDFKANGEPGLRMSTQRAKFVSGPIYTALSGCVQISENA